MDKKSDIAKMFLKSGHLFVCPICKGELLYYDNYLKCNNNHTFDISKKGTINLINTSNLKSSSIYNKDLFTYRRIFIARNYYEGVYTIISEIINKNNNDNIILDFGCGEGAHSINILNKLNFSYKYYGFDYSKDAISLASDYNTENIIFFEGDVNNVPLKSKSVNIIIDFLSPYNDKEIKRLLKDDGIFIKVSPGKDYLKELRKEIGLNEYEKEEEIFNNLNKHFSNIEIKKYNNTFEIDKDGAFELLNMTPVDKKLDNININKITIDLNVYVVRV